MQLQSLDRPGRRRASRGRGSLRTETVLKLPCPISRQEASYMFERDLLRIEENGQAAAAVFNLPTEGVNFLVHSDPAVTFRSNRTTRILRVTSDSVVLWGKREGEPRGLYFVSRRKADLMNRLDQLEGVRHVGQTLVPFGRNVDDPEGFERYLFNGESLLIPIRAACHVTHLGMLVAERHGFMFTERLYGKRGSELVRSVDPRVGTCLPLRWHRDTLLVAERDGVWSLILQGEEFPLRLPETFEGKISVSGVWTSPNEASLALLVSYGRQANDPAWLPPMQKLIVTDQPIPGRVSVIASGRFSNEAFSRSDETTGVKPIRIAWSEDGRGLAAIIDTVKRGFDDEFEEIPERQPIVASSNGDLIVGDPEDVFSDVAVRSNGSIALYIKDDGSDHVVSTLEDEVARHAFAWQPRARSRTELTYAFVDGAEVRFAATH